MKIFKTIVLALAFLFLTSCNNSPAADGEKAAKMQMELPEILTKYGYDSEQYRKAASEAADFSAECLKKYEDDEKATEDFNRAYFEAIKAEMQKEAK